MVTAPHRAAAEAGAEVLAAGGNAIEAMIAAAATIAVVYPHMNGIGGDAFFLIAEPGKPPRAIDACGAAGSLATIERYRKAGYDAIPSRGAEAALTVAGAVSGWALAHEAATRRQDPAPRASRRRHPPGPRRHRRSARRMRDAGGGSEELKAVPGFAAHFLVDGKPPEAGRVLVQERLADTLDQLAHAGFDDFYRGDIAVEIAADLEEAQAPVTRADLAATTRASASRCRCGSPTPRSSTRRRRRRASPRSSSSACSTG